MQLKSQQERVEQLVDNVVQGYHGGFNKSIHNYSQILHLFPMAKDQVTVGTTALSAAACCIPVHNPPDQSIHAHALKPVLNVYGLCLYRFTSFDTS